jgi:hypothetical protein
MLICSQLVYNRQLLENSKELQSRVKTIEECWKSRLLGELSTSYILETGRTKTSSDKPY